MREPILLDDNPECAVFEVRALINSIAKPLIVFCEFGREDLVTR